MVTHSVHLILVVKMMIVANCEITLVMLMLMTMTIVEMIVMTMMTLLATLIAVVVSQAAKPDDSHFNNDALDDSEKKGTLVSPIAAAPTVTNCR